MNNIYYVYTHSIKGRVFYVGSAQGNPNRAYDKNKRPKEWHELVQENKGEYDIEIVEYCQSKKEAKQKEIQLIYFYHDIGQAECSGEDLRGVLKSDEHRKKLSENNAHYWLGKTGKNHPMYGKQMSKESRKKISENHTHSKSIVAFKDDEFYGDYPSYTELAFELIENKSEIVSVWQAIRRMANGWIPSEKSKWYGWKIIHKEESAN